MSSNNFLLAFPLDLVLSQAPPSLLFGDEMNTKIYRENPISRRIKAFLQELLKGTPPPFPALFENGSSEKFETFRADRSRCVE
jgi:hypothetical protein